MKHYNHIKKNMAADKAKEPTVSEVAEIVTSDIQDVWKRASFLVVSHTRVMKLMRCTHNEFRKLIKSYKARKTDKSYMSKLQADKNKQMLYDIAVCKCSHGNCKCAKEH